jgi:hypothetical protein
VGEEEVSRDHVPVGTSEANGQCREAAIWRLRRMDLVLMRCAGRIPLRVFLVSPAGLDLQSLLDSHVTIAPNVN